MKHNAETQKKKTFGEIRVPHTFVIIFAILLLSAVLTYLVPAGTYDYVEIENGRKVIDADSYHAVEANPTGVYELFDSIPTGLVGMAPLIFFVFIAGGTFGIINATQTMDVAVNWMAKRLEGREKIMVFLFVAMFSLLGCVMGFSTECIIFIPIGVRLARQVGYDAIVGTSMILMGSFAGFVPGAFNPYTTAVAQEIVGLPAFSGLGVRLALQVAAVIITGLYTIRYGERIKRDPARSYIRDLELESAGNDTSGQFTAATKFSVRNILVLITMLLGFSLIIYGALNFKWSTKQMAPVFIAMGILCGIVGGLKPDSIATSFLTGARSMIFAGLVIGMGRAILVVMESGNILNTVIYGMSTVLQHLPAPLVATGMLISNIFINFFVPSGSGQATLVMPIMGPLAQITNVPMQTAVMAFQIGDGFTNAVVPTSSVTNSAIGISNISFGQWLRFSFPLTCMLWLTGWLFMVGSSLLGLA